MPLYSEEEDYQLARFSSSMSVWVAFELQQAGFFYFYCASTDSEVKRQQM